MTPAEETSVALPPGDPVYGSPTATQLLEAVEGFLRDGLAGDDRALSFKARVAANVVAIVRRQLEAGGAPYEQVRAALDTLGVADEAALSARVREGAIDHRSRELRRVLELLARTRLAVSNPQYLERESTD